MLGRTNHIIIVQNDIIAHKSALQRTKQQNNSTNQRNKT